MGKPKRRSYPISSYPPDAVVQTAPDNEDGTSSSSLDKTTGGRNGGAYIDHRKYDDLAHFHSSPARTRRRSLQQLPRQTTKVSPANDSTKKPKTFAPAEGSSRGGYSSSPHATNANSNLPLTNRNLQNLLRGSHGQESRGGVSLDMDRFAREQSQLADMAGTENPFDMLPHSSDGEDYGANSDSDNSLEFGESNPSSDDTSDSRSLHDVCFPDYYDHDQGQDKENTVQWPDLRVLYEFVLQEQEHHSEHITFDESVPLEDERSERYKPRDGGDGAPHHANDTRAKVPRGISASPTSKASDEQTPLLDSTEINEVEVYDGADSQKAFKVRPTPIQPWEKSNDLVPILHKDPEHDRTHHQKQPKVDLKRCRFTYFRSDLEKTIHSPTISGLVAPNNTKVREKSGNISKWQGSGRNDGQDSANASDDDKSVTEMTFEDLFLPGYQQPYSHAPSHAPSHGPSFYASNHAYGNSPSRSSQDASTVNLAQSTSGTGGQGQGSGGANANAAGNGATNAAATNNAAAAVPPTNNATASTNNVNAGGEAPTKMSSLRDQSYPASVSDPTDFVNPFWLDVLDPTEEEMKVLSKTFGIHPLTTEDIFLGEAREKVELFSSYYFICFASFDIVYEIKLQRTKEKEKKLNKLQEMYDNSDDKSVFGSSDQKSRMWRILSKIVGGGSRRESHHHTPTKDSLVARAKSTTTANTRAKKIRDGELSPLNMYIIVFKNAIITFHFSPTPHPINVRRRARLLRDYLTVSSDWLCYALIDDITDSFAPMIESIEEEVNSIEDAILKMHSGDANSDSDSDDESDDEMEKRALSNERASNIHHRHHDPNVFYRRERSKSTVDRGPMVAGLPSGVHGTGDSAGPIYRGSSRTGSSRKSGTKSSQSKILGWRRKGDMLRRIGECRKRVMSVSRLLGSKADVIKGFSKRFVESFDAGSNNKIEIGMYLGDIQDHIVTMVQSLNHYEKLLARFHSNYLAQINIDMTQVNNDTNDVLSKITILGSIVLPINVVTGLWGMNCLVPGQGYDGLAWFWSIVAGMVAFSIIAYNYAKRASVI